MICDFKKGTGGKGRPRAAYLSSGLAVCQLSHATALSYSNQHMPLQLWANLHAKLLNPPPRTRQGRRSALRHRGPSAPVPHPPRPGARGSASTPVTPPSLGPAAKPEPRPAAPCLPSPRFPCPPSVPPCPARLGPEEQVKGACGGGAAAHTYLRRDYRPN